MGGAVGAKQARLRESSGIASVGLYLARPRRIHGGEVRIRAIITSWPRASRHRATHSLSVEASISRRARGRVPSTAEKRAGSVRIRCSTTHPPRQGYRSGFPSCARRCQYGPWLAPFSCACERVIFLWDTLCHHVEWGVSRFIPSILLPSPSARRRFAGGSGAPPAGPGHLAGPAGNALSCSRH